MDQISSLLDKALLNKKLNKTAHREITRWLEEPELIEFLPELKNRITNERWDELLDQFYRIVSFGTGGIRGVMDIGTNRINNYTIRWTSQAYAAYLQKFTPDLWDRGIGIAHDSRHNSEEFVRQTAAVLAANGIPVKVFDGCRATPELSFAVRYLGLAGGIVVTASHNPPQFNGWKVYDHNGVQMLPDQGNLIEQEFKSVTEIKRIPYDEAVAKNMVTRIDAKVDEAFLEDAMRVSTYASRSANVVFSPLHGVGSMNVLPALHNVGFTNVLTVDEQMTLDGSFPTVKNNFPQPEFPEVYEPAINLAKSNNADLVLVSDPDADRLGMAVPDSSGAWHPLSGNQAGVLMGAFYLEQLKSGGKLPSNPVIMKTTVTTELIRDIGESYGAEVIGDLLVGFKFIGDRLEHLSADKHFLFAAEESIGYLFSTAYRDKGAESPAVIAAEMASWAKDQGISLLEFLDQIYSRFGYYAERLHYKQIEGLGAIDQMNLAMAQLRKQIPTRLASLPVVKTLDRLNGEVRDGRTGDLIETRNWDKGDMLTLFLSDDERNAVHIRPSGTEPKMKYYTMVKGDLNASTKQDIDQQAQEVERAVVNLFDGILKTITVDVFTD